MKSNEFINRGILLMLMVAFYQSILAAIAKAASPDITTGIQVLAYYLIPLLMLLPGMLYKLGKYNTNYFKFYFLRGLFTAGSVFCFFYASKTISLGSAAILFNLTPVYIPIFSMIFLNEKTSKQVFIGIIVSLCGVIVIINPAINNLFTIGMLLGLLSGIFMAIAQVMLRYFTKIKEPIDKIIFYLYLMSVLASFIIIISEIIFTKDKIFSLALNVNLFHVLLLVILLGLIGLVAQQTLTKAFQYLPAAKLSPLLYCSVPISSLIGWVIWGQKLTFSLFIGTPLILVGILFITFDQNKEQKCIV